MIRDFYLRCQYRNLPTKLDRIAASTLVRPYDYVRVARRRDWRGCGSAKLCACVHEREPQCSFVNGKNGHEGANEPREFVTTRWSLILSATHFGSEEQRARDALAELCRTYWRPIFSFVRLQG